MDDAELTFVDDYESAEAFIAWMRSNPERIAVDTETEGLDLITDKVRLLQLGDTRRAFIFPFDGWGGLGLHALSTYTGRLVFHHAKFDVLRLEESNRGWTQDWSRVNDTMIASHLINPDQPSGLKAACDRHLGHYASVAERALASALSENKWTFRTVPLNFHLYWGYAGIDTILTARLDEKLQPQIEAQFQNVYDLEIATSQVLANMERLGMAVDLEYVSRKSDEINAYLFQVEAAVRNATGFGPGQNAKLAAWFEQQGWLHGDEFNEQGLLVKKSNRRFTPKGQIQLDASTLEELAADGSSVAALVKKHRDGTKILSSYLGNLTTMHRGGIVHPSIKQLGARTARMSITNPALQTLPRGRVVRDAFVSRYGDEGVIVSADSDQIEMRLLAHFSQDASLIDAILSGDLHTETAKRVYQDPNIGKGDPRRQVAKNAGFAKIYGAGVEQFSKTAQVTVEAGKAFLDAYDQMFPGVRVFQKQVEAIARERRDNRGATFVVAPSGRRHPGEVAEAYKLVNYLVQGTAADVLRTQLVGLSAAGFDDYMVCPVHDEVIFDFPKSDFTEDTLHEIEKAMTMTEDWAVPITAGAEGPFDRWGAKYR